jgi:hypothetical protein
MCWTHLNDTRPKARKKYTCHLCGLPVPVGQVHVARRGVSEGAPVTVRMHADCEEVTHGWRDYEWETFDEWDFREEKARFFANAKPETRKDG